MKKAQTILLPLLLALTLFQPSGVLGQGGTPTTYDVSLDFSTTVNPTAIWSYGWKSNFTGDLTLFSYSRRQFVSSDPPGGYIDVWSRFANDQSVVWRNSSDTTLSAGGTFYPPGTVIMSPGVNGREDNFAVIRFTAPAPGIYLVSSAIRNLYQSSISGDTDFYVLHNGVELFAQNLPRDTATVHQVGGFTNTVNLLAGDTLDFLNGRGLDGSFNGSGITLQASISLVESVEMPPRILTQPQAQAVESGESVFFKVTAVGTFPLFYQWQWNGEDVMGATNASFSISSAQTNHAGNYAVVVSNAFGTIVSSNAELTVIPVIPALATYDLSTDYSKDVNPAAVWSYGWKNTLNGLLNPFRFSRRQFVQSSPAGGFIDVWSRFDNDQSVVWRNSSTATVYGGWFQEGVYPPGTVIMSPGVNSREDNFAAIRFTAPVAGTYMLTTRVQNLYHGSISGDTDFHVLHNGLELFGQNLPADKGIEYHRAAYTNSLNLNAGDTLDFLNGRGPDGDFSGSGVMIQASLHLLTSQPVPPSILRQPTDVTAMVGENVTFTIAVASTPNLGLQWRFNGNDIPGANNPSLVLTDVQLLQAGPYSVVVTNDYGAVTSSDAFLTVVPAVTVYDLSRDYSTNVNPASPWSYGWKVGFGDVFNPFAFARRQFVPSTPSGGFIDVWSRFANDQSVVWHNGSSSTVYGGGSQGIYPPGTVIVSPGVNGREDNYAVIRFTAPVGGMYLVSSSVRNMFHGSLSGDTDYHVVIDGLESFNQSIPADSETVFNSGGYTNTVTLGAGSALEFLVGRGLDGDFHGSGLAIQAKVALLNAEPVPPTIVTNPKDQNVFVGSQVTFAVVVSGAPLLSYQWKWNGNDIEGATNSSLVLNEVQLTDSGTYSVVVNNEFGSVSSSAALLTVTERPNNGTAPVITSHPSDQTTTNGGTVTFFVEASGTSPLTYQWLFNGGELFGQTNDWLSFNVQTWQAGNYSVRVSNPVGTVESTPALLTVIVENLITPGTVAFMNRDITQTPPIDAPISFAIGGPAPAGRINGTAAVAVGEYVWGGVNAMAGLYAGPPGCREDDMVLLAPAVGFRSGVTAGFVNVGSSSSRAVPTVAAGSPAVVQIRVWDVGMPGVASYEQALQVNQTRDGYFGKSDIVTIDALGGAGMPPGFPARLAGLSPFSVTYRGASSSSSFNPAFVQAAALAVRLVLQPQPDSGAMHLEFLGTMGQAYYIQASSDLSDWITIGTCTTILDGPVQFDDTDAANAGTRFYRVVVP